MSLSARTDDTQSAAFHSLLAAGLPLHSFWSAPVLVGTSGGADSVALLLGLDALSRRHTASSRLVVVHARHDLREESAEDAAFVRGLAERHGLPCVIRDLPVRAPDGPGSEGVEARARRRRLDFFAATALEFGARHVAVAHTADDQAETILHRILRGTGLVGLQGMAAARQLCDGVSLVRPLLAVPRATVRAYLDACGQPWREDRTNADIRYARNFLRHEILPRCESGPYPAAQESLIRLAGHAAGAAGAVRSAAGHLLDVHARRQVDGSIVIRSTALATLDRQLVAEVFVELWRRQEWPQRDMTARHYALLASMAAEAAGTAAAPVVDLPGGVRARVAPPGEMSLDRIAGR